MKKTSNTPSMLCRSIGVTPAGRCLILTEFHRTSVICSRIGLRILRTYPCEFRSVVQSCASSSAREEFARSAKGHRSRPRSSVLEFGLGFLVSSLPSSAATEGSEDCLRPREETRNPSPNSKTDGTPRSGFSRLLSTPASCLCTRPSPWGTGPRSGNPGGALPTARSGSESPL